MAINNNFLTWVTPPTIVGYVDAEEITPIADCIQKDDTYILPVRGGDVIKFIYPNEAEFQLFVALVKNGVVIDDNIGTIEGIYGTATIPEDLPFGYYNLFIHTLVINYLTEWTTVSSACETDDDGHRTGYFLEYQEREYEQLAKAVALSCCLKYGIHRKTNVIRFRDDYTAFGFNYTGDAEFYQQFRLHVEILFPDYQVEEAVYRQSNGYRRFGNVYIDEKQELRTAAFDQRTHQCLISALKHRFFFVGDCQYFAAGAYSIDNVERGLSSTARTDIFTQDFDLRNFGCVPPTAPTGLIGEYSGNDYSGEDYNGGDNTG